jgi:hypothetical protein
LTHPFRGADASSGRRIAAPKGVVVRVSARTVATIAQATRKPPSAMSGIEPSTRPGTRKSAARDHWATHPARGSRPMASDRSTSQMSEATVLVVNWAAWIIGIDGTTAGAPGRRQNPTVHPLVVDSSRGVPTQTSPGVARPSPVAFADAISDDSGTCAAHRRPDQGGHGALRAGHANRRPRTRRREGDRRIRDGAPLSLSRSRRRLRHLIRRPGRPVAGCTRLIAWLLPNALPRV